MTTPNHAVSNTLRLSTFEVFGLLFHWRGIDLPDRPTRSQGVGGSTAELVQTNPSSAFALSINHKPADVRQIPDRATYQP
jgi:hypothetical protein